MTPPETRYAKSGDVHIAYQVVGDGPLDLIFVPGFVSNVELAWESPGSAQFFSRLAAFSRLILFDKRGTGLSDRHVGVAHLEERMHDVRAVMDAVGSERAALFGVSEGGAMSMLFAATYPERTRALTLYGTYARHPTLTPEALPHHIEEIGRVCPRRCISIPLWVGSKEAGRATCSFDWKVEGRLLARQQRGQPRSIERKTGPTLCANGRFPRSQPPLSLWRARRSALWPTLA